MGLFSAEISFVFLCLFSTLLFFMRVDISVDHFMFLFINVIPTWFFDDEYPNILVISFFKTNVVC